MDRGTIDDTVAEEEKLLVSRDISPPLFGSCTDAEGAPDNVNEDEEELAVINVEGVVLSCSTIVSVASISGKIVGKLLSTKRYGSRRMSLLRLLDILRKIITKSENRMPQVHNAIYISP